MYIILTMALFMRRKTAARSDWDFVEFERARGALLQLFCAWLRPLIVVSSGECVVPGTAEEKEMDAR